jgi:nucleoside-diphosphate-sugar epimerase
MRLAVFGATGGTGRLVVEQALAAGHEVTALARNPDKLGIEHARLKVVKGDIADAAKVEEVIAESDAVISLLGPRRDNPPFAISQGMERIVAAMKKRGVKRIVMTAGMGIPAPGDEPKLINKAISALLGLMAKDAAEDMRRAVDVARTSGLEYTALRVPRLTDKPAGQPIKYGYVGKGVGFELARADFATALLEAATQGKFVREMPGVSN